MPPFDPDAYLAATAPKKAGFDPDVYLGAPSVTPQAPVQPDIAAPPVPQPPSAMESAIVGLKDPVAGAAQLLVHLLPGGIVSGVNKATQYVNDLPGIGPLTKALGMVPATPESMDADIQKSEQDYQARRGKDAGIDWWRLGGNVASTAPLAAMASPTLAGAVGGGVATGAMMPATGPKEDYWSEKAIQAGAGGAGGAVGNIAGRALARAISPQTDPAVAYLMSHGVTPTPGQIMGGGAKAFEEKMTGYPIVGDVIKGAQRRSMDQLNQAVYKEVLAPIGETAPTTAGRAAVAEVGDKLSDAYNSILPQLTLRTDQQLTSELANLSGLVSNLPPKEAATFSKFMNDYVGTATGPRGIMDGLTLKELESKLAKEIATFGKSTDAYQQKLGDAFKTVQQSLRDALERSNQGVSINVNGAAVDAAQRLKDINSGWARLVRLEKAAGSTGADQGVFTPAQLSAAIRDSDTTVRHRGFARGDALMQEMGDAGKKVLGNVYPDSGSPGRIAAMLMTGGALPFSPTAAGAGAAMIAPYTKSGGRLAAALMTQRPNFAPQVSAGVRKALPASNAALAAMLAQQSTE